MYQCYRNAISTKVGLPLITTGEIVNRGGRKVADILTMYTDQFCLLYVTLAFSALSSTYHVQDYQHQRINPETNEDNAS